MSFVGPRPDVPGYADKLTGDDRDVLKLRPGITGPATLKYRLEDEMLETFVKDVRQHSDTPNLLTKSVNKGSDPLFDTFSGVSDLPDFSQFTDQQLAVWYNDNVVYPDKVRLNCYYYRHYSFIKDIEMIFATVLGFKVSFAGEEV